MKPIRKSVEIDKITFSGIFTPEEPAVMYTKNGDGYPGAPAEFDVDTIEGTASDMLDLIESMILKRGEETSLYSEIQEMCIDKMKDDEF